MGAKSHPGRPLHDQVVQTHRRHLCMPMALWSSGDGEVVLRSVYVFLPFSFRHSLVFFSFSRSPE